AGDTLALRCELTEGRWVRSQGLGGRRATAASPSTVVSPSTLPTARGRKRLDQDDISHPIRAGRFCATLFGTSSQVVDSKRTDVGVVDRSTPGNRLPPRVLTADEIGDGTQTSESTCHRKPPPRQSATRAEKPEEIARPTERWTTACIASQDRSVENAGHRVDTIGGVAPRGAETH